LEVLYDTQEILSIKPHYAAVTNRITCTTCGTLPHRYYCPHRRNFNTLPEKNKSEGEISKKAKQKITTYMNWMMLFSSKKYVYNKKKKKGYYFKINFITLTLSDSQKHSDEYIKEHLLQPFIKWLRRSHNVVNYIWKAETQKNNNIHFHITTNKFIHWQSIRNKWNQLQQNHGYLNKYFQLHGNHDANSTDVHSVKNDQQIVKYMVKYITKNEPNKRKVTGKIWDCNNELKKLKINYKNFENNYYELKNDYLELTSTKEITFDFGKIHFTRLTDDTRLPASVADKLHDLYLRFLKGDDGITKYSVN